MSFRCVGLPAWPLEAAPPPGSHLKTLQSMMSCIGLRGPNVSTPPHFIHNKQVLVMSGCGVCLCLLVSHTLDGFSEIRKYVCVITSETGAFRFWNLFTLKGVTLTSHALHWISLAQVIIMWPTFQCGVAVQELSQDQLGKPSIADREHFENSKRKIRPRLETGENPLTAVFVLDPQYFWICLHRLLFLLDTKSYFSFL